MKICGKCNLPKPETAFYHYKDKALYACKDCSKRRSRQVRSERIDVERKKEAEWRAKNKEAIAAYHLAYRQANPEKFAAYRAKAKQDTSLEALQRKREYQRAYRQKHRESIRVYIKSYREKRKANPSAAAQPVPDQTQPHHHQGES